MKKFFVIAIVLALMASLFAGCAPSNALGESPAAPAAPAAPANPAAPAAPAPNAANGADFNQSKSISVVSREDGSGTRGAFIELFKVEVKAEDGSKKDRTTKEAIIADKTDIMMTNIANDPYAIGYISLGSLNETIKALDIDGVKASTENVKNGTYKISRPFNIATKGEAAGLAQDFIGFIFSKEGQEVIAKSYIAIDGNAPAYAGNKPSGKITVGGSSSVNPVMEKLKEAYIAINPNADIEIQVSDSTAGMTGTMDGTFDIGMASRELKDSEKEQLTERSIALDGIAVVVNNKNPLSNVSSEQVNGIFTGEITTWNEL